MADSSPKAKTEVSTSPTGDASKKAVPQTTSLFRLMNFELFVKPVSERDEVFITRNIYLFIYCFARNN